MSKQTDYTSAEWKAISAVTELAAALKVNA
jgi:hypothetical protein